MESTTRYDFPKFAFHYATVKNDDDLVVLVRNTFDPQCTSINKKISATNSQISDVELVDAKVLDTPCALHYHYEYKYFPKKQVGVAWIVGNPVDFIYSDNIGYGGIVEPIM